MAEYRMLPLWTDALLGDTQHLSAAEFGAYMLMLIVAWRSPDCSLPDDDRQLANLTRTGAGWRKMRPVVTAFWTRGEDGKLRQKRLSEERTRSEEFRGKQSAAGKSSALKRKERRSTAVHDRLERSDQPDGNQKPTSVSVSVRENPSQPSSSPPAPPARGPADADAMTLAASLRDRLEAKLNLAVPVITAPIVAWLQAGASPELVEAVIDDVLSRRPEGWKPAGIGYFDKAVRQAIATGSAPSPAPAPERANTGYHPTTIQTRDEIREQMRQRAITIKRGIHLAAVSNRDVLGMIKCGWLTQAEAEKAGYEP